MKNDKELKDIQSEALAWAKENIKFYRMGRSTIEVETPLIDAFGQKIYCFVEKNFESYRITDDSWIMYKLDPLCEDEEFQEEANDIVLGSGFDFDNKTGEIFQEVSKDQLFMMLNNLAQLQVALSFIK